MKLQPRRARRTRRRRVWRGCHGAEATLERGRSAWVVVAVTGWQDTLIASTTDLFAKVATWLLWSNGWNPAVAGPALSETINWAPGALKGGCALGGREGDVE